MSRRPISEYAFLSDCHGAALVSTAGSVDWLCLPRFDHPAIFARLLDDSAGYWCLAPTTWTRVERRYLPKTLVLETRFETDDGAVVVEDLLAVDPNQRGHDLGTTVPHALLRRVRGVTGEVMVELDLVPRPEYGLVCPRLSQTEGGVLARGGAVVLHLTCPPEFRTELELDAGRARAQHRVRAGDCLDFCLEYRSSAEPRPEPWTAARIDHTRKETIRAWQSWSQMHQRYEGPWRDLVLHSGRVLQGLTYVPTGAIVAAATTSLPEVIGGELNWDYRFCWIRDASFTLEALWVAACPDEAHHFFDFLATSSLSQPHRDEHMQIMFGVGGEIDSSERVLDHLEGWRQSRPVRIGNAAWRQTQLDVYGELLSAAHRLADQLGELDAPVRELLIRAANGAASRWHEPDQGIWEARGSPRHYVYSKLMCWVALDRALRLAPRMQAPPDAIERWEHEREQVRAAILDRGWSDELGAFSQVFGEPTLDASSLVIALVGFLPPDDPRVRATIEVIARELADERGLIRRYHDPDGECGEEGSFLLCTFWLAEAQARAGELELAQPTLARAAGSANDVGLLAEEVDSATGELLGNMPQAFSHIGLINAAWAIAQAEQSRDS